MDMSLSELQETVKDREAWHAAVHRAIKSILSYRETACFNFIFLYLAHHLTVSYNSEFIHTHTHTHTHTTFLYFYIFLKNLKVWASITIGLQPLGSE